MVGKRTSPPKGKKAKKPTGPEKAPRKKPALDKRELFIRQYLIHKNASRAYLEAGFEGGIYTRQNAHRLLTSDYVQGRLAEEQARALDELDVKVDQVFTRLKHIAFGDIAQITQYKVGACRYCHGVGHAYQWRDIAEYQAELELAIAESDRSGKPVKYPHSQDGGFGYSRNLPPHPECPQCDGDGIPRIVFKDTRLMTEAERALFAGVEQTQHGIKYRFEDRMAAIERLAEHLQFYKKRDDHNANALARAIAEIQSRGAMGRMPINQGKPGGGSE